jgi:hypothetical protein
MEGEVKVDRRAVITSDAAAKAHLVVARHSHDRVTTLCAEIKVPEWHRQDLDTRPGCIHCLNVLQELRAARDRLPA